MASKVVFNCLISEAIAAMKAERGIGIPQNAVITGISSDSRSLKVGDLFFALAGENFDGHRFVGQALTKGAIAVVVSEEWSKLYEGDLSKFLIVKDVLRAYQDLAQWWRSQCNVPLIAITGSAGKTTTKEIISQLLSFYGAVHKSIANHNNDIGVAQTLFGIDPDQHQFVVVEMGMRGLGEIARLAEMAAPDVGVITNIGTAHIGRLGSQTAIAQAKCELLENMPQTSIAVLNGEDQLLMARAAQVWQGETLKYGIDIDCDLDNVRGELLESAKIRVEQKTWDLPLQGRHNAMNFLAGLSVVRALGLDWQKLSDNIGDVDLPEGRSHTYQSSENITILDETYNSSPEAAIAALHLLAETPTQGKRWAVLGAMKELGEMSSFLHSQVGKTVKELKIDCLVVLTDGESDAILTGAGKDFKYVNGCSDRTELITQLLNLIKSGDTVLFKASHSVGMDTIVSEFVGNV